jgi:hypothetical protein
VYFSVNAATLSHFARTSNHTIPPAETSYALKSVPRR